ncbi:hypothetical protein [Klebsiella quasipneumoniae]
MLKQKKIEVVIEELARLRGHDLNTAEMLELRCRVSGTFSTKERQAHWMTTSPFQWKSPIRHADERENIVLEQL